MSFQKITATCGILGCIILLGTVGIAILPYVGMYDETYSFANHYISELGDRRFSENALVFNLGLICSSSLLLVFAIGFMQQFKGWQRWATGFLGILTAVSCCFVGIFPVDILGPHILVAMVFFHSALVMVFLHTAITLFAKQSVLPKWTVGLGFLTAGVFAAFVISPNDLLQEWVADPKHFQRPEIWVKPILEWACFFSIILWIVTVAALMLAGRLHPAGAKA